MPVFTKARHWTLPRARRTQSTFLTHIPLTTPSPPFTHSWITDVQEGSGCNPLQNIVTSQGVWILDGVWIGWLDLLPPFVTTINKAISLIYTLYSPPLHTYEDSQSSLVVSWQRIYNSLTVSTAHSKSSLHSLIPFLAIPSQSSSTAISRDSLIIISAGPGASLYSLGADPTENTVSIVIAQQYPDCCLCICCRKNLFTESLPRNERLLWLRYFGF
jgi:hypothetical protein